MHTHTHTHKHIQNKFNASKASYPIRGGGGGGVKAFRAGKIGGKVKNFSWDSLIVGFPSGKWYIIHSLDLPGYWYITAVEVGTVHHV